MPFFWAILGVIVGLPSEWLEKITCQFLPVKSSIGEIAVISSAMPSCVNHSQLVFWISFKLIFGRFFSDLPKFLRFMSILYVYYRKRPCVPFSTPKSGLY